MANVRITNVEIALISVEESAVVEVVEDLNNYHNKEEV